MSFKLPTGEEAFLLELNEKLKEFTCPEHNKSPIAHSKESIDCCCEKAEKAALKLLGDC